MLNTTIICKKTIDDSFLINKEYKIEDGFLYTEQNISINATPYETEQNAIQDLNNKGYTFNSKINSDAFGGMDNVFGDIFNIVKDVTSCNNMYQKRQEANDLKNDILKDIFNNF